MISCFKQKSADLADLWKLTDHPGHLRVDERSFSIYNNILDNNCQADFKKLSKKLRRNDNCQGRRNNAVLG